MKKLNQSKKVYFALREWRDKAFLPMGNWLLKMKITANMVSVARLLLVIPMFFLVGPYPWAAILLILLNYLLDGLDGVMARKAKTESTRGRALDVCIDNFYVVPLVLALIWFNELASFWAAVYLINVIADYFINFLEYGIEVENYPFFFHRYFVYGAFVLYAFGGPNYFDYVMILWAVTLTIVNGYNLYSLYQKK